MWCVHVMVCFLFGTTLSANVKRDDGDTVSPSAGPMGNLLFNIRLAGSSFRHEGRVEVMVNNDWGTVCSNGWDANDVRVVCAMLGYNHGGIPVSNAERFGQGLGDVFMDAVACRGTESSLEYCDHAGYNANTCTHASDAGVICHTDHFRAPTPHVAADPFNPRLPAYIPSIHGPIVQGPTIHRPATYQTLDVRLVQGFNMNDGVVETRSDGQWVAMCADEWDEMNSRVACRQLGYSDGRRVNSVQYRYNGNVHQMRRNEMHCSGVETHLFQCPTMDPHNGVMTPYYPDRALTHMDPYYHDGIRNPYYHDLMMGPRYHDRIMDPHYHDLMMDPHYHDLMMDPHYHDLVMDPNHRDPNFDPHYRAMLRDPHYHDEMLDPRFRDFFTDPHYHDMLMDPHRPHTAYCNNRNPVAITCSNPVNAISPSLPNIRRPSQRVRLVGPNSREGIVYVNNADTWGTICSRHFGNADASVVCRELGFARGIRVPNAVDIYGEGIGLIWINNLECSGLERSVFDCLHSGIGNTIACNHREDVGVRCR